MLHNTGPFGPNETPVNMGAPVNIPELNSSVNIAQNLNNLVKMSQQSPHSNAGHFNFQNYSGLADTSLSSSSQLNNFQNHNQSVVSPSLAPENSNSHQSSLRPNGMFPENFSFNSVRSPNPSENPFLSRLLSKPASSIPDIMNRRFKDTKVVDNLAVSPNAIRHDNLRQQIVNKSEFSVNETNKSDISSCIINNISIKISPERDEDSYRGNESDMTSDHQNALQDSDSEDMMPLSLTRTIKQEPLDEIETNIVVKVEQISSWTDTDHMQAFLKDTNGLSREDSSHSNCNIVDCERSIAEATEIIKTGTTTDLYFECPNCCLLFNHPKRFLIHTKWHSFGIRSEKRTEETQDKLVKRRQRNTSTKKIEEIKQEIVTEDVDGVKNESGSFTCKSCDKTFENKTSLRNHRHKFHPNREHECKVCNKVVLGWFGLKTHMATHNTEAVFQCDQCPKRFKHAHSLAKHRDTHLEKTHACPQCPKKFGSQNLLKMHMRTHERMQRGPTFSCSYCSKAFYESYTLQVHERTHRNERPFQCEVCNTSYGTNSSLKRHMKVSHTHSTSKPFECSTCHRCFVSELIRDRHAAREHGTPGQLQHACNKCSCRYLRVKDLQRHMYRMHPKGKKRRKSSDSE